MRSLWAGVAAAMLAVAPAIAQTAGGGGTPNQAQQPAGSGQNAAGSVTQPGMAQTNNTGQNQTGNYGTGIAGGRADPNPRTAPK